MTEDIVITKVKDVFIKILHLDNSQNMDLLVYNETPGWDSVAHMTLVVGLEESFDCMLEMDDILDMSSYAKVIEIMRKYV